MEQNANVGEIFIRYIGLTTTYIIAELGSDYVVCKYLNISNTFIKAETNVLC